MWRRRLEAWLVEVVVLLVDVRRRMVMVLVVVMLHLRRRRHCNASCKLVTLAAHARLSSITHVGQTLGAGDVRRGIQGGYESVV